MYAARPVLPSEADPPSDSHLDAGIGVEVNMLRAAGIETFESCQGGEGHSYKEPTVAFNGDRSEGFRALAIALRAGWCVKDLRRVWRVVDGEPWGPWWQLVFAARAEHEA